jgi:hypothetical protein
MESSGLEMGECDGNKLPTIAKSDIITEVNKLTASISNSVDDFGILKVKTASKWLEEASKKPIPKMLFSTFWFENELSVLFADTNLGKSILAVQIAHSISSGVPMACLPMEADPQPVLYFDFELNDKQFEKRYSNDYKDHFQFSKNFFRVEINTDYNLIDFEKFEEQLNDSVENAIIRTKAKILIVDNLTYLKSDNEKAKDATPFMRHLGYLKNKYELSILILAHTPKRDNSRPLTKNDLQGSRSLLNFVDSAFAIGESQLERNMRYLKQIKVRGANFEFGGDNVMVFLIEKKLNFLGFHFKEFGFEEEHLKKVEREEKQVLINKVKELSKSGKSQRVISDELNISLGAVNNYLRK